MGCDTLPEEYSRLQKRSLATRIMIWKMLGKPVPSFHMSNLPQRPRTVFLPNALFCYLILQASTKPFLLNSLLPFFHFARNYVLCSIVTLLLAHHLHTGSNASAHRIIHHNAANTCGSIWLTSLDRLNKKQSTYTTQILRQRRGLCVPLH